MLLENFAKNLKSPFTNGILGDDWWRGCPPKPVMQETPAATTSASSCNNQRAC